MKLLLRVVDPLEGSLRRGRRCRDRCGGRYDGWRRAVWQTQLRHHPRDLQPRAYPSFDDLRPKLWLWIKATITILQVSRRTCLAGSLASQKQILLLAPLRLFAIFRMRLPPGLRSPSVCKTLASAPRPLPQPPASLCASDWVLVSQTSLTCAPYAAVRMYVIAATVRVRN